MDICEKLGLDVCLNLDQCVFQRILLGTLIVFFVLVVLVTLTVAFLSIIHYIQESREIAEEAYRTAQELAASEGVKQHHSGTKWMLKKLLSERHHCCKKCCKKRHKCRYYNMRT